MTAIAVLIVDDRAHDRDRMRQVVERLADGRPCDVVEADNYETAVELISTCVFDLILLDLVLKEPPGDRETWEGFWLLQDLLAMDALPLTRVIVTSQFAERDDVTRIFRDFHADDVWFKSDPGALEEAIRASLTSTRFFGQDCDIQTDGWSLSSALEEIVGQRHFLRLSSPVTSEQAAGELEHLLKRLFWDCDEVLAQKVEGGASAAGVLRCSRVLAGGGPASDVIAKFGLRDQVADEAERWGQLREITAAMRSTRVEAAAIGRHVGITRYSFLGLDLTHVVPLEHVVLEAALPEVEATIAQLFGETCRLWYAPTHARPVTTSIIGHYLSTLATTPELVGQAYEFKFGRVESGGRGLSLAGSTRLLPHPVSGLRDLADLLVTSTVFMPTHGDLHPGNVFVETASKSCWLIDFGRAGYGHWARDFAELELAVRFQAADPPPAGELFAAESAYVDPLPWNAIDLRGAGGEAARRAARITTAIRAQARTAGANIFPGEERAAEEYVVALYAMGLNYFRLHKLIRSGRRKHQVQMALSLLRERVSAIERIWRATT